MRVSITGQEGFIGYHLYNSIKYRFPDIKLIDFKKDLFKDETKIDNAISKSEIIVHLAGINRHEDQEFLYNENMGLAQKIIDSIKRTNFSGKLLFASSTHEELNNPYGRSKKTIREYFQDQSLTCGFDFLGLIIPNVFGPYCKPNYNSFVSTFSYNLINCKNNELIEDKKIPLLYVANLVDEIISLFNSKPNPKKNIKEDINIKVSEVNKILENFNDNYFHNGVYTKT